ncbi:urease accessory protein UreE [Adhaeribacter pallidiroseus]|uniref:Urease accessory protein UreE n=1 Tax=Adhaeribacter pallidiroseus TaxID=2072847 RepID=A0A369QH06_9BACT|nr:urease accessory protein UreE [Adhaeribacter pallidiroseus]RDC62855.1 Urease accessory protein UreE [Adhaeribacter pallidiroseus]
MIIKEIIGNTAFLSLANRTVDYLYLEWFETTKRIIRKETAAGQEVAIKLLQEGLRLQEGDVLWVNESAAIVVSIIACEAIVITPQSLLQMGTVCYEIGNKHLPLFIQDDEVLVPYEAPLFRLLAASGYQPQIKTRKLLHMLKANVVPHEHERVSKSGETLFTKILNLSTKS